MLFRVRPQRCCLVITVTFIFIYLVLVVYMVNNAADEMSPVFGFGRVDFRHPMFYRQSVVLPDQIPVVVEANGPTRQRRQPLPNFQQNVRPAVIHCVKVHFSTIPLPRVALTSFPGSGNTWLRHLIQQSTGIFTGSVYNDKTLKREGFDGEGITDNTVIVVKTHEWGNETRQKYDKVILVIRDPFEAIQSEFNRHFGGHLGYAGRSKYSVGTIWQDFVYGKSQSWTNTALEWLKIPQPLLIVKYENLKTNVRGELYRILDFLNYTVTDERMNCTVKNSLGRFKRPERRIDEFDPFTPEMRETLEIYKQTVNMAIQLYSLRKCESNELSRFVPMNCTEIYMKYRHGD